MWDESAQAMDMSCLQMDSGVPRCWSISKLLIHVGQILKQTFSQIWVQGEIQTLNIYQSGHIYFTVKDDQGADALLSCVMFRMDAQRLGFSPNVGDVVQMRGELNIYAQRGQLNFIVRQMQPAGEGLLYARFIQLKEKLQRLGLFEAERKKTIPTYPRKIGIVTSPKAAALQDAMRILTQNAPWIPTILYSTAVQGTGATQEIVQALQRADEQKEVDVILLIRGGGSLTDLWCFNEEAVAHQLAKMHIPVVTGVGHETDTTIVDWVADYRAPTPTAAAHFVTQYWAMVPEYLDQTQSRLTQAMSRALMQAKHHIGQLARLDLVMGQKLSQARQQLNYVDRLPQQWLRHYQALEMHLDVLDVNQTKAMQVQLHATWIHYMHLQQAMKSSTQIFRSEQDRLQWVSQQLPQLFIQNTQQAQLRLSHVSWSERIRHFSQKIDQQQAQLGKFENQLYRWMIGDIQLKRERVKSLSERLRNVEVGQVLKRGYAIVTTEQGALVRNTNDVKVGDTMRIRLQGGSLQAEVEAINDND